MMASKFGRGSKKKAQRLATRNLVDRFYELRRLRKQVIELEISADIEQPARVQRHRQRPK
jgi:hypothetical protein